MSKHLAAAARARTVLRRVEPLLADLDDTFERWSRYDQLSRTDGYYARLNSPDRALDDVNPPQSVVVDRMTRRVSPEFPAWSNVQPGAVPAIATAGYRRLLMVLASHPDGYVRGAAISHLTSMKMTSVITTLVLRCLDPVPQIRQVAVHAVNAVLDTEPFTLVGTDYAVLKRPQAIRLVPELAAKAARVQVTDHYTRRRDRYDLNLVDIVGPDALVEVEDLPPEQGEIALSALVGAGIDATVVSVPVGFDGTIFRTRLLVWAAEEPRAIEIVRDANRLYWKTPD